MAKITPKKVAEKAAGPAGPEAEKSPAEAPAATRTMPEPIPPRKPLITFDRWFASKKEFKPHWKAGMEAFTNTNIRRTAAQWDEVFKSY